jgi:hypothetical protein
LPPFFIKLLKKFQLRSGMEIGSLHCDNVCPAQPDSRYWSKRDSAFIAHAAIAGSDSAKCILGASIKFGTVFLPDTSAQLHWPLDSWELFL